MDYSKLTEITVKSQVELDAIPLDFKGRIYIEFGTYFNKAVVKNKYFYRVVAWGNSSVVARGNSSVVARENSSVVAAGNTQVLDCLRNGRIEITGNARIVYNPKCIEDFMNFYNIKHTKKKAIFYKAVKKDSDGVLYSDYDINFTYEVGKIIKEENIDTDTNNDCGRGIHISHLAWAVDYGRNWDNLVILEVETNIDGIILPKNTNGKVRTSRVKVLREVPLEECGLLGKILAKGRAKK